ncbi:MAG: exosortase U [Pirellulaceae bacterium]
MNLPPKMRYNNAAQRQQTKYAQETRSRGNDDLGERSDLWYYSTTFGIATVSFDQMFPGWHELTQHYRNAGWIPDKRTVIESSNAEGWPIDHWAIT